MELLDRLDAMIDERHLLKHPFYTRWAEGTLPLEALQEYTRQYYAFESAMPRFLSALHTRTADKAVRQEILDNLWDEEHGAGVMTHRGRVIATGQADCSFVEWIARQGLERL